LNRRALDTFNKVPFYTQELVSRIIRASTVNPKLFARITEKFYNPENEDASFITFVLGGAGTGKTTAVFGLNIDQFRSTNDKSILRVTAPTDLQTNNLDNSIKFSVGEEKLDIIKLSKQSLFEQLGINNLVETIQNELNEIDNPNNKYIYLENDKVQIKIDDSEYNNINYDNLPNLILIDEVTHFSFAELRILNEISKRSYYNNNSNFVKVIAAGDPNQLGYFINYKGSKLTYNVNAVNGIFTPRLVTSIRSANNHKRVNSDLLVGLTQKLDEIYEKELDRQKANDIATDYLAKNDFTLD